MASVTENSVCPPPPGRDNIDATFGWRNHVTCIENDCFHGTSCGHPKIERDVWWGPWRDIDVPRHGMSHRPGNFGPMCAGYYDGCTLRDCICICHDADHAEGETEAHNAT